MNHKRVFVGLSGGVDSSVAALRLLNRGYDVVGVFIKVWQPDFIRCDWEKERLDAMRVAAHLGIPFLTCDAEDAYKKHVADYMIDAYRRGLTPNPDVMCNEFVKFGAFYEWARERGADFVATGHYARVITDTAGNTLHRAIDTKKDQSYFLARMSQDALNHALFPIGDTQKEDVRNEAKRAGLPTFKKADSQGICFLGQVDVREFLSHFIPLEQGRVLHVQGEVVGTHEGALLYTKGQRHGFTLVRNGERTPPHYVVDRDMEANTITVSETPPVTPAGTEIELRDMRALGTGIKPRMDAVFHYHGARIPVAVTMGTDGDGILIPDQTERDIATSGQLCVLYDGDECCGSGIIV